MTDNSPSSRHQLLLKVVAEEVVRPSFRRSCDSGPEVFDTFYAKLADHVPGVGAMFANTDMQKQNELISAGIATLIDFACGDEAARIDLERLATLHDDDHLNVQPQMYAGWVDALMDMVAEFDPQRSDTIEIAWREVVAPGIALLSSRYHSKQ